MKYYKNIISEDNHPKKIHVIFSAQINQDIITIKNYNQANTEALSEWYNYIDRIKEWLSNPSIAWDYANRFRTFPNGARYISDFNYNIGYTVKTNQYGAYVYVFMINFNLQEFGLKIPPTLKENKIQNLYNTMRNKKVIRLTESDLHRIIKESIQNILSESVWYGATEPFETIVGACHEIKSKFNYVNDTDYEDSSDDNSNMEYRIFQWADRVENEAMNYIELNADKRTFNLN